MHFRSFAVTFIILAVPAVLVTQEREKSDRISDYRGGRSYMDRRTFLKRAGSIPVIAVLLPCLTTTEWIGAVIPAPSRRGVHPSDVRLPRAAKWDQLKQQVEGHLIPVRSQLAPSKDATQCPTNIRPQIRATPESSN